MSKANIFIPVIFMTGYGDIPMSVRAMKAGAVDFLTKPFRDQDMVDAVTIALERDRTRRTAEQRLADLRSRLERLSPREREVLALVVTGLKNKQIAFQLNVAEITVKAHRGHVMQKMGAQSVADLVKMTEALGIKSPPSKIASSGMWLYQQRVCSFAPSKLVGATIFHQAHAFERGQIALVELSKGMASIIPKYAIDCSEAWLVRRIHSRQSRPLSLHHRSWRMCRPRCNDWIAA